MASGRQLRVDVAGGFSEYHAVVVLDVFRVDRVPFAITKCRNGQHDAAMDGGTQCYVSDEKGGCWECDMMASDYFDRTGNPVAKQEGAVHLLGIGTPTIHELYAREQADIPATPAREYQGPSNMLMYIHRR